MSSERGSASVLVLAVGALLSLTVLAVGVVATGLAAHRQAVRAADLAALAGAQHSLTDRAGACRIAGQVAHANGADLENCWLETNALRVQVIVPSMRLMPTVRAIARAGPAVS